MATDRTSVLAEGRTLEEAYLNLQGLATHFLLVQAQVLALDEAIHTINRKKRSR